MKPHCIEVFQLCSYLLNYPTKEIYESFSSLEKEVDFTDAPEIKKEIDSFLSKAQKVTNEQLATMYVDTFDFGKKTNLYVTYMSNGEQRERAMDLLFIKNYYKLNGFDCTDLELPDYLPIMLEFASTQNKESVEMLFTRYIRNILEMIDSIKNTNEIYGHLVEALRITLNEFDYNAPKREELEKC